MAKINLAFFANAVYSCLGLGTERVKEVCN
jgi:hypothetical protein